MPTDFTLQNLLIINTDKNMKTKTIYLRRQGSSNSYNTNNAINSQLGLYIEVNTWPNNMYHIILSSKQEKAIHEIINKRIEINKEFDSLSDVFRYLEKSVRKEYSMNIAISDTIERYCHGNLTPKEIGDKYLAVCFYEKSTETIRLYPANYCLVSFKNKRTKDYLQMDKATARYLPILKKQAAEYEKEKKWSCHICKSEDFLRERFAWLIGEDIKRNDNNVKFYLTDSLIK